MATHISYRIEQGDKIKKELRDIALGEGGGGGGGGTCATDTNAFEIFDKEKSRKRRRSSIINSFIH